MLNLLRRTLGIRSPSREWERAWAHVGEDMAAGLARPAAPYIPPDPITANMLRAQYPPFEITEANIGAVIAIVARYGYRVETRYTDEEYICLITSPIPYPSGEERYDSGEDESLSYAFDLAFRMFCNDFEGAMRREIAGLV